MHKVIRCDEDGREYTLKQIERVYRKELKHGNIGCNCSFRDYLKEITGKNGACSWIHTA